MQLELISFNGHALSTNYYGWLVYPHPLRLGASADFLEVAGTHAEYTGKSFGGGYLTIQIRYEDDFANVHTREEEIKRWFNTLDEMPYKLLVKDTSDGDRQWYVMASPLTITQENNSAVIVMALDKPFWYVGTASSASWALITSPDTKTINCIGESARPVFTVTPGSSKSVGYLYYRFVEVAPPSTTKVLPSYPLNLGPYNTSALYGAGKAQADGDDFIVLADNISIPRYFGSSTGAFNTTVTNIWTVLDWKPAVTLTLKTAIAGAGAISDIAFVITAANKTALAALPATGILKIVTGGNTEYFTYSGKDAAKVRVTGVSRAGKLSTAIAHNALDVCTWIQHDIWFVYGNSAATTPEYDESKKPIFDLDLSSNTSWVYTQFFQEGKSRAGAWSKSLLASTLKVSAPYTGSHGAIADPATEAGLRAATAKVNNVEKGESVSQVWALNCPAGITHIASMTIDKYRYGVSWPVTTQVQKSLLGTTFILAQALTTPTLAQTWQTQTITALSLAGSYTAIKLVQSGSLAVLANNEAMVEIQGCTLTIDVTAVPVVSIKTEYNTYFLEAKISNVTTGEAIWITYPMKLTETITVDCNARRVTYQDGTRAQAAISLDSDRVDWLNLQNGNNELMWEDAGTLNVAVGISWRDVVAV